MALSQCLSVLGARTNSPDDMLNEWVMYRGSSSFPHVIISGPGQLGVEAGVWLSHDLVQFVPAAPEDCWF